MENKYEKQKLIYIDLLRIFTIFTVVILHVSAQNWTNVSPQSTCWQVFNIYNSFVRCNVSVFVMISGALFLDKSYKLNIKKLLTKNILRVVIAYIFWSFIYALISSISINNFSNLSEVINFLLTNTINSHYHLWFLPMIIGVYFVIPLIKPITDNKNSIKICKYLLIIFFVFGILKQSIFSFEFAHKDIIYKICNKIYISGFTGWIGYFVLGYYLRAVDFSKTKRLYIYIISILGCLFCTIGNGYISYKTNTPSQFFYFNFSFSCFVVAIAWFVFFKYKFKDIKLSEKFKKIINIISKNMFGTYLVHAAIIKLLLYFGLNTLTFNALFSVPIISIIVFIIAFFISYLISKIPVVSKYII